jgi:protein-tyrosine phosphatase
VGVSPARSVIDLHCHILPGLDDGAPDTAAGIAMARVAEADGVRTIAATPHIRDDHPFPLGEVAERAAAFNEQLAREGVGVKVVPAGEVALTKCSDLDDGELERLCLGEGRYLLVESPYTHATDMLEHAIFDIQRRGFRPLLAHPERSPSFMSNPDRLVTLVERGVRCSVTAGSITGGFGKTVQGAAFAIMRAGAMHDIASDAHDSTRRRPELSAAVRVIQGLLSPGEVDAGWFVSDAPELILAGEDLPDPPQSRPRSRWRRLRAGGRGSSGSSSR